MGEQSEKPEVSTPPQPEEKVTVTKELLEGLQERLDRQDKDIKQLLQIADKKRLSLWYQRHKEDTPPIIKLRTFDCNGTDKVIVGWRTTADEVYKDSTSGKWFEKQEVELMFEDGTTKEMALAAFNREYKYIECKRTGTITDDKTGILIFKLTRLSDGKEYEVGAQYVN